MSSGAWGVMVGPSTPRDKLRRIHARDCNSTIAFPEGANAEMIIDIRRFTQPEYP